VRPTPQAGFKEGNGAAYPPYGMGQESGVAKGRIKGKGNKEDD